MKVAIVGVGHVGATLAYSLLEVETIRRIHLIGRNLDRLRGESLDLRHAASLYTVPTEIIFGTVSDCRMADIVVLALSVPQKTIDRNELAVDNGRLFAEVVPTLAEQNPEAVFVVASNPVEALTQLAIDLSGFPPQRVIGAGTIIDSCRFRAALSEHLCVHPDDLRVYVLGEHGDSQFFWQSGASVGGVRLQPSDIPSSIVDSARSSGAEIMQLKGHTSYAISQALQLIIRTIAGNECRTMPVSTQVSLEADFPSFCLAVPCVVGRRGVEIQLTPHFTNEEQGHWLTCAQSVATTLARIHNGLG